MPDAQRPPHVPPRTPLVRPHEYFAQCGFDTRRATAAVALAAAALAAAFLGFGVLLSDRFRSAGHPEAASAVWEVFGGYLFGIVAALVVGWLVTAGVLHLLARAFVGHDGRFEQTVVVTGWGSAPTVLSSLVAFAMLAAALGDVPMTSPQVFAEQFRSELAETSFLRTLVSFLVAGWQTYVFANGLQVAFETDGDSAVLVAGVVAYGGWLLTLI